MLKFIPPKEERQSFPRYASYGAGQLKTHGTLSGARNSLNNRIAPYGWSYKTDAVWKRGYILENVEGEWYILYHVAEGSTHDELPWMKEYYHDGWRWSLVTDTVRNSAYYQGKFNSGQYRKEFRSTPMTTDEYVAWRLAVERERLGIS